LYKTRDGETHLEVRVEQETVWLTQAQIAKLLLTDRSVISRHISNTFSSNELEEKSNVQKMHIAFSDKPVNLYSLDVIISVGYRVNSSRATQFRIWATQVLKSYLLKGYALNEKRLREQEARLRSLESAISLIQSKSWHSLLKDQAKELLSIIHEYAKSLTLLGQYDEGKLKIQRTQDSKFILRYDDCIKIVHEVKGILIKKKEAGSIFGQETNAKFKGIIGALYQTFDRKDLYKSLEEKAAHLLYLTIKDHPFVDGNKRIASRGRKRCQRKRSYGQHYNEPYQMMSKEVA
jgi:hypothetical protein